MIPVLWLNLHPEVCRHRSHWDVALLSDLFDGKLGSAGVEYAHHEETALHPDDWPPNDVTSGAVVMVPGRFHFDDVDTINEMLSGLHWAVAVVASDEESLFPWQELDHPNMRRWVMTPAPETHRTTGVRFIGEGWSRGTPQAVKKMSWMGQSRRWTSSFLGQVTHPRREACVAAMMRRDYPKGKRVHITDGFAHGLSQDEYLGVMCETKFAPCPSGPVTADSFRVYEALEAGCVPILDCVDGQGRDAMGFWKLILGEHPIPLIRDWSFLPALVETLLPEWETLQAEVQAWWQWRKDQWVADMAEDVKAIS